MKLLKKIYFNFYFYTCVILFSCLAIPALSVFVVMLLPFLPRRAVMKRIRRCISWYGAVIIRVIPFPFIRIDYKDFGSKEARGPYIFVCNHRSTSDAFLMACLPFECVQVVNIWPFKLPIIGFFARFAGYLSVREMSFEDFNAKACQFLKEGVSIIVFPEGTRSGSKVTGQFHSAIFRVALESKCRIAPVCITGNERIPVPQTLILEPGLIKVYKLPVIDWQQFKDFSPFKLKNWVRDLIIAQLAKMEVSV